MAILLKSEINRLIKNSTILRRAENIVQMDRIDVLTIEDYDTYWYIYAQVDASFNYYANVQCTIIKSTQQIQQLNCDYPGCHTPYCEHFAAVLILLSQTEIPTILPYTTLSHSRFQFEEQQKALRAKRLEQERLEQEEFVSSLLNTYKETGFHSSYYLASDKQLTLSAIFKIEKDDIMLSFKIGNEKMYVVSNLASFITRFDDQLPHKYGNHLTVVHRLEYFDDASQQMIGIIKKAIEKRQLTPYTTFPSSKLSILQQHEVSLNELCDITSNELSILSNATIISSNEKLEIVATLDNDLYSFQCNQNYYVIENNVAFRYSFSTANNHLSLYRIQLENGLLVNRFFNDFIENNATLPVKFLHEFIRYVINPLKDDIDFFNIDIEYDELDEPQLQVYGEVNEEDNIVFRIDCHYPTIIKKGFNPSEPQQSYELEKLETFFKQHATEIDETNHIALFDPTLESTLLFLKDGLAIIQQHAEVFISEDLKRLTKKKAYSISVGVRMNHGLLEVDINSDDIPKEELSNLLRAYKLKKKFYKLKSGELLNLESDELEQLNQTLIENDINTKDIKNGQAKLPLYRLFSLHDKQSTDELTYTKTSEIDDLVNKFNTATSTPIQLDTHYETLLRDYQKIGVQWLSLLNEVGFGGILADDMGLGKTLQVIVLADLLIKKKGPKPSLVVCPASLILNWQDELAKFAPHLKSLCLFGTSKYRLEAMQEIPTYDMIITSYDYIRRDIDELEKFDFRLAVLDEAQNIKNQKTKNASTVKRLHAEHRLALTGTPIENSLAELWSIFDFLMPNYLYPYSYFKTVFETPIVKFNDEEASLKLKKLIEPFILRRNKKEVLHDLPDKVEEIMTFEFNEEENNLYYANLSVMNQQLQERLKTNQLAKFDVLPMLTKLRQLCCEPRLVYSNITTLSSKLSGCLKLIERLKAEGKKILLFSSFTTILDLIEVELYHRNISSIKLTGSTPKTERRELVNAFQNDDTSVFLISLKAGGTGLNLTAAQAVIHYDPWWNISAQNQATDRAYRIGQRNDVSVYKLIMRGTIEEKIVLMQEKKKSLSDSFINTSEGSIFHMETSDLIDLFSMDRDN